MLEIMFIILLFYLEIFSIFHLELILGIDKNFIYLYKLIFKISSFLLNLKSNIKLIMNF